MEASALHAPTSLGRRSLAGPLLRLRSDEQLVALFRAGSEEAFTVLHDRYRQRLFAYVRQMLATTSSRGDAEDVLQDVFVRAYGALRADERDVNVKAWLYRVAHNRCIDHLRRPTPPSSDVFDVSRTPLQDPIETAQRREDLRRLVDDVGRLPEQQRSALLMREIDGLAYADIAAALDVTVPAVKSLLVRARIGLVEAIEARDTDCSLIREDLAAAYDRGVKASGRARKHMRECSGCREYRTSLRSVKRSFAALSPVGAFGPLALVAKALGGGGAAAGGGAAVGGAGAAGSGVAAVTACKVAAVVCTAAITAGAGVEVKRLATGDEGAGRAASERSAAAAAATGPAGVAGLATAAAAAPAAVADAVIRHRTGSAAGPDTDQRRRDRGKETAPPAAAPEAPVTAPAPTGDQSPQQIVEATGGAIAPAPETTGSAQPSDPAGPVTGSGEGDGSQPVPGTTSPGEGEALPVQPSGEEETPGATGSAGGGPPPEH